MEDRGMAGGELRRWEHHGPEIRADLIVDSIPDGLVVLDAGCRMCRWNRAMERLAGYSEEEMLGQLCSSLDFRSAESGEPLEFERECMMSGVPDPARIQEVECTLKARDGELIPVRKYGRVLANEEGIAVGILLILTDLRPLRRLEDRISSMESVGEDVEPPGRLVGASPAMISVYRRIYLAARSDVTVLISGETGTGKELIADAIHEESTRRGGPLVKVNCSALSENLLESELFGHVKGAFTGAVRDSRGRIEMAEGGTLFLDEIGDVSPLIQLKLLRVLQERQYERVGEASARRANVRFIAATHRDLKQRVEHGLFREDFYYRIRVYPIEAPSLREHKSDIDLLCEAFIRGFNAKTGKRVRGMSAEARAALLDYCWPGNVRQLENAVEHAFVSCDGDRIALSDLPDDIRSARLRALECEPAAAIEVRGSARRPRLTRERLLEALERSGWNRAEAARLLGVDRTTVWRRMKHWHLADSPASARD
jgi:two-component system, NtrC family, response regulator HydG